MILIDRTIIAWLLKYNHNFKNRFIIRLINVAIERFLQITVFKFYFRNELIINMCVIWRDRKKPFLSLIIKNTFNNLRGQISIIYVMHI